MTRNVVISALIYPDTNLENFNAGINIKVVAILFGYDNTKQDYTIAMFKEVYGFLDNQLSEMFKPYFIQCTS